MTYQRGSIIWSIRSWIYVAHKFQYTAMDVRVQVRDQILKSVQAVYEAIVNPKHITGYFTSNVSGLFEAGQTIQWHFADVGVVLDVQISALKPNEHIAFTWRASGQEAKVSIDLSSTGDDQCQIEIVESAFAMDGEGIRRSMQQTQGWTDFICSLKAYLYTGINLRNGRQKKIP